MSPPLTPATLLAESARLAAILLGSYALGALATVVSVVPQLGLAGGVLRFAFVAVGSTLALLYVLARGVSLGTSLPHEIHAAGGVGPLLHGSAALAVPLALWFGLAALSTFLVPYAPLDALAETLVLGCTATGLATAALYVVARAASLIGGDVLLAVRPTED